MSVNEYVTKFTQLSHYAWHEVDTDEKKQECFLNGLNEWTSLCFGGSRLCELPRDGKQGSCAGESHRCDGVQE
jgi:hypothetical protein